MGEFGGIISASIVYRGEQADCMRAADRISEALLTVPTKLERERSGQWTVLVPFSDTPEARGFIRTLVREGVIPEGA